MRTTLYTFGTGILLMLAIFGFCAQYAQAQPIVAAWDWAMPKNTDEEQREYVRFAQECGFNTLHVRPTETILKEAHARGMKVFDVMYSRPSGEFIKTHPECLQKLQPFEQDIEKALGKMPYPNYDYYVTRSHREFPILYTGPWLCYEHEESIEELCWQIQEKFERFPIDGIALDFFGFKNMYGCFCDKCVRLREEMQAENPDMREEELMARFSEESLLKVSQKLYDFVKSIQPEAITTCHIYPPFYPNPDYSSRFRVDYSGPVDKRGSSSTSGRLKRWRRRRNALRNRRIPAITGSCRSSRASAIKTSST